MKRARLILASLVLGAVASVIAVQAQGQSSQANPREISKIKDEIRLKEQILQRMFQDFERSLLQLKQRLERSPKEEDKARAAQLSKVLEECADLGIGVQFEQMLDFLTKNKFGSTPDLKIGQDKAMQLANDLRRILDSFREDSKHSKARDERVRLEQLIKELERIIHNQKVAQGITEAGKTDSKELRKIQEKVSDDTAKLAKAMGDKNSQGGEGKDAKGDNKEGGKGEGKAGESKDAGKAGEGKKGETKEAGPNSEGKQGDAKGDKGDKSGDKGGKEGQQGEAKPGQKGAEGKEGGAKDSKGGEGKQGEAKDNKGGSKEGDKGVKEGNAKDGGEKKAGAKEGDKAGAKGDKSGAKGGKEGSPNAEAKAGEKKGGDPKEGGAKGSKGGDPKAGDPKGGDSKGGDPKDSKQGDAKSGESSKGQGEAKDGGQQGGQPPPDGGQKGPPPQPKGPQDPKDNIANGKKQVEDANYKQKQAEDNIAKKENKPAADDQGKAIDDLNKAKKKLEDLLRQIREEELERLLAALQARCEKMLAMQMQVLAGTERVAKDVANNVDKKVERKNQQDSIKLSDQEKEIVNEATKAIEMLEGEGSAVAFPEVFQQVREDMKNVQRRLEITEVGDITQAIERDIIDTLKEMIDALKKAKQELDNKKSPPGQPKDGQPPPTADQKLLDQIAELKMIRSMQIRVNSRTKTYAAKYVPKEGEQTADPIIRGELQELSQRQERIFDITHKIAKGDNK